MALHFSANQMKPAQITAKYRQYPPSLLTDAYIAVKEKNVSVSKASKMYQVPAQTLRDRVLGKIHIDTVTTAQNSLPFQYERNFKPTLLQNWEVPRQYRERPRAFLGFTQIVASDRGHLLPGVKRSRESPWGTYVGTWDMPIKIPGNNMMNCTARTDVALTRLQRIKTDGDIVLGGKLKQCKVPSPLPVKADIDADKTLSPKVALATTHLTSPGNGERSGARNPEPKTSVEVPGSAGIRTPVKPSTPNITWPAPTGEGAVPKPASPLPPIVSKPGTPVKKAGSPTQDLKWPSPRAEEQPVPV